jgi:hypothetical protein
VGVFDGEADAKFSVLARDVAAVLIGMTTADRHMDLEIEVDRSILASVEAIVAIVRVHWLRRSEDGTCLTIRFAVRRSGILGWDVSDGDTPVREYLENHTGWRLENNLPEGEVRVATEEREGTFFLKCHIDLSGRLRPLLCKALVECDLFRDYYFLPGGDGDFIYCDFSRLEPQHVSWEDAQERQSVSL